MIVIGEVKKTGETVELFETKYEHDIPVHVVEKREPFLISEIIVKSFQFNDMRRVVKNVQIAR
ncbi:MAG TPA: hypothetical protein VKI62_09220 [Bacteroidota bacterium]|nr:hypothetical protein [Bacteroidota bacterium]